MREEKKIEKENMKKIKNTMGISFSYPFIQKKFLPNVSLKCFQFHQRMCFTNTVAARVVSATVVSNAPLKKRLAKQFLLAE
jgi:hexokinase